MGFTSILTAGIAGNSNNGNMHRDGGGARSGPSTPVLSTLVGMTEGMLPMPVAAPYPPKPLETSESTYELSPYGAYRSPSDENRANSRETEVNTAQSSHAAPAMTQGEPQKQLSPVEETRRGKKFNLFLPWNRTFQAGGTKIPSSDLPRGPYVTQASYYNPLPPPPLSNLTTDHHRHHQGFQQTRPGPLSQQPKIYKAFTASSCSTSLQNVGGGTSSVVGLGLGIGQLSNVSRGGHRHETTATTTMAKPSQVPGTQSLPHGFPIPPPQPTHLQHHQQQNRQMSAPELQQQQYPVLSSTQPQMHRQMYSQYGSSIPTFVSRKSSLQNRGGGGGGAGSRHHQQHQHHQNPSMSSTTTTATTTNSSFASTSLFSGSMSSLTSSNSSSSSCTDSSSSSCEEGSGSEDSDHQERMWRVKGLKKPKQHVARAYAQRTSMIREETEDELRSERERKNSACIELVAHSTISEARDSPHGIPEGFADTGPRNVMVESPVHPAFDHHRDTSFTVSPHSSAQNDPSTGRPVSAYLTYLTASPESTSHSDRRLSTVTQSTVRAHTTHLDTYHNRNSRRGSTLTARSNSTGSSRGGGTTLPSRRNSTPVPEMIAALMLASHDDSHIEKSHDFHQYNRKSEVADDHEGSSPSRSVNRNRRHSTCSVMSTPPRSTLQEEAGRGKHSGAPGYEMSTKEPGRDVFGSNSVHKNDETNSQLTHAHILHRELPNGAEEARYADDEVSPPRSQPQSLLNSSFSNSSIGSMKGSATRRLKKSMRIPSIQFEGMSMDAMFEEVEKKMSNMREGRNKGLLRDGQHNISRNEVCEDGEGQGGTKGDVFETTTEKNWERLMQSKGVRIISAVRDPEDDLSPTMAFAGQTQSQTTAHGDSSSSLSSTSTHGTRNDTGNSSTVLTSLTSMSSNGSASLSVASDSSLLKQQRRRTKVLSMCKPDAEDEDDVEGSLTASSTTEAESAEGMEILRTSSITPTLANTNAQIPLDQPRPRPYPRRMTSRPRPLDVEAANACSTDAILTAGSTPGLSPDFLLMGVVGDGVAAARGRRRTAAQVPLPPSPLPPSPLLAGAFDVSRSSSPQLCPQSVPATKSPSLMNRGRPVSPGVSPPYTMSNKEELRRGVNHRVSPETLGEPFQFSSPTMESSPALSTTSTFVPTPKLGNTPIFDNVAAVKSWRAHSPIEPPPPSPIPEVCIFPPSPAQDISNRKSSLPELHPVMTTMTVKVIEPKKRIRLSTRPGSSLPRSNRVGLQLGGGAGQAGRFSQSVELDKRIYQVVPAVHDVQTKTDLEGKSVAQKRRSTVQAARTRTSMMATHPPPSPTVSVASAGQFTSPVVAHPPLVGSGSPTLPVSPASVSGKSSGRNSISGIEDALDGEEALQRMIRKLNRPHTPPRPVRKRAVAQPQPRSPIGSQSQSATFPATNATVSILDRALTAFERAEKRRSAMAIAREMLHEDDIIAAAVAVETERKERRLQEGEEREPNQERHLGMEPVLPLKVNGSRSRIGSSCSSPVSPGYPTSAHGDERKEAKIAEPSTQLPELLNAVEVSTNEVGEMSEKEESKEPGVSCTSTTSTASHPSTSSSDPILPPSILVSSPPSGTLPNRANTRGGIGGVSATKFHASQSSTSSIDSIVRPPPQSRNGRRAVDSASVTSFDSDNSAFTTDSEDGVVVNGMSGYRVRRRGGGYDSMDGGVEGVEVGVVMMGERISCGYNIGVAM